MPDPTNDPERREAWNNPDLHWETDHTPITEFNEPTMSDFEAWGGEVEEEKDEYSTYVSHPSHYNNRKMEAIDIIEMIIEIEKNPKVAYNMSNVLKYLLRFRDKGTPIRDLQKAGWYLQRMIEKIEEEKSE